jgi:hypothetical protein
MDVDLKKIWEKLKDKKNVVGYSGSLAPKIKDNKAVEGNKVFRVYVSKKEPVEELDPDDVIPEEICGIEIDVFEVGEIKDQ